MMSSSNEAVVEVRRIELLSEDSLIRYSPSAVRDLTFPPSSAYAPADDFSSFIVPIRRKA